MSAPVPQLLAADVRHELSAVADPSRAPAMQAYMKSTMPFYGVPAPAQRKVFTACFARHPLLDRASFETAVLLLWDDATHREERYAAVALARRKPYRRWLDHDSLGWLDHLVVTGAWWDHVDAIAAHLVGPVLRREPTVVAPTIRRWAVDEHMWRRRTAILSQLAAKDDTDTALLVDCIEPSLASKEFFLRKAIGWALRQYAYSDPRWVTDYVRDHRDVLSPLSAREATKHLPPPTG